MFEPNICSIFVITITKINKKMATFTKDIEIKTVQATGWRGNVNTFYKATIGNSTYQCVSMESLLESIKSHKKTISDASSYYGNGHYNGD